MSIGQIVVGVDSSEGARRAAAWSAALAGKLGAHVTAVHVVSQTWLVELGALQVDTDELVRQARVELTGTWTAPFRDADLHYTVELAQGDPATELLRVAAERNADLIVIGGTHHSGFRDALLGGTAHRVVNRGAIPVAVIPVEPGDEAKKRGVPIPG